MKCAQQKIFVVTAAFVRQRYDYCPDTGALLYKEKASNRVAGDVAGYLNKGRRLLSIKEKRYLASRVIWLWMTGSWPACEVDHANRNKSDDRWLNLRAATRAQNGYNRDLKKKNKHGYRGVIRQSFAKGRKVFRYSAQIMVLGKHLTIGRFATAAEAAMAYDTAAKKYHGEFARLNFNDR